MPIASLPLSFYAFLKRAIALVGAWSAFFLLLGIGVDANAANTSSFISQSVPTAMVVGKTYPITIVMRNTGTTPWAATGANAYSLGTQNPQGNQVWGVSRINLASNVAYATNTTFTATITAPSTPGTYNFQWQMQSDGAGAFGALTPNLAITVGTALPGATLTSPTTGTTLPTSGASATLRVTGTSSPYFAGPVTSFYVVDNDKVIYTSPSKTVIDTTVTLAAGMVHRLKLRALAGSGLEGFSAEVPVTVTSTSPVANCQTLIPSNGEVAANRGDKLVYGNNATGFKAGSDIGSALVHAGLLPPGV
jgi:hypothetical protein